MLVQYSPGWKYFPKYVDHVVWWGGGTSGGGREMSACVLGGCCVVLLLYWKISYCVYVFAVEKDLVERFPDIINSSI